MGRFQIAERVRQLVTEQRLSLLLVVFVSLSGLFLWLLPNSSEGRRWLAMWQAKREEALSQRRFQDALAKDPPLGFPLKETVRQVRSGRSVGKSEGNFSHLQSPIGRKEVALQNSRHRQRMGHGTGDEGRRRSERKGRQPKQSQTEKKRHHRRPFRPLHRTFTALS